MKYRQGFVSNSSSSSFILNQKGVTAEQFISDIENIWNELYMDYSKEYPVTEECKIRKVARFIDVQQMAKLKAKQWITDEYRKECWSATGKTSRRPEAGTYLNEALKATVFGVAEQNSIPYEVLEAIAEKYKNHIVIRHLG